MASGTKPTICRGDTADVYKDMTREQLIELLVRREKYNFLLQQAIRHYAMNLLDEIKKYRENDISGTSARDAQ